MNTCGVTIKAVAARVPSIAVRNFDEQWFSEISEADQLAWQDKWGIEQRFFTDSSRHTPLQLAHSVAAEAISLAQLQAQDIDMLISGTTNVVQLSQNEQCGLPKKLLYPRVSQALKQTLALENAIEFDIQNECSTMMDAMQIGHNAIKTGRAKQVLLVVFETSSNSLNRTEANGMNFGDGYAAIVLSRHDDPNLGIQSQSYQSFPNNYSLATVKWDEQPKTPTGLSFHMPEEGASEMGKFVPKTLPKLVYSALEKSAIQPSDIDFYVFHQPARKLIDAWCAYLKIPSEKTIKIMQEYGCAVSAAMPLAFNLALLQQKIAAGSQIVIASPSVGWGFGAQVWQLGELPKCSPQIHQSILDSQNTTRNESQ
ncbi:3-oxoacyl-ACP synthase III family protein [Pseudoalteromonas sp. S16_S37]|uniref:3-oxoacyl-ACP synthase III family protein n=1 Tax=Pseudoalteromonas sp. S16_S37 TaxID=2720228 RepID=UPI0016818DC2|nr:3-oxoacyl-ACP synthase III family protein [Pseudoalteromonas sp. S16_S37]MBD1581860.1 3-oxoacyl-ACP synthase III family protein [Pseudoalteromonas sp. S16_S37]